MVGGHYWNAGVNGTDPDPWTPEYGAIYETTSEGTSRGEFTLNSGYGFDENKGHAVVIHASDGSRVGCGVLAGPGMTGPCGATGFGPEKLQACVTSYPGTENDVEGKVVVTFDEDGDLTYKFYGVGLEESVEGAGTHIHSGTTCEGASLVGGHYWDAGDDGTNPDPWVPEYDAVYKTFENGNATGMFTINSGYGFEENDGHAVVVHDSTGARVGCGVLGKGRAGSCIQSETETKKLQACITAYPGTTSTILGKIVVRFDMDTDDLTYEYRMRDLEVSAVGGTHIHTGTTCDDASLVGGHYWDTGVNGTDPDPWTAEYGAVYETNVGGDARGSFTLNSGYGYEENAGHAVVVHDSTGARVGCGVLGKGKTGPCF